MHLLGKASTPPSTASPSRSLDSRARSIAADLQGTRLWVGERALLLYPAGLEFIAAFFGCLYAGVVAVPSNLPRLNRPMPRLQAIVTDSRPRAVLTASGLLGDADRWVGGVPEMAGLQRLATDVLEDGGDRWETLSYPSGSLAFLQYTSGSTATPRGVRITHGNLVANSREIRACFGSTEQSRGVFWAAAVPRDMGLIGGVLQTVFCGGSSLMMSPVSFLQKAPAVAGGDRPDRRDDQRRAGFRVRPSASARSVPRARAGLGPGTREVAFNGAEMIRPETLDRFSEAFAPCGFRREAFLPCYGLAESTLLVSGLRSPGVASASSRRSRKAALGKIASRRPPRVTRVRPRRQRRLARSPGSRDRRPDQRPPLPGSDRVGEIWVRGSSVASGYWRADEARVTPFRATLGESGEGPFLRTGDLGFVRHGELFVTGRLKDLIIIRGRNVYPQDIEWSVSCAHEALRHGAAAAFSVEIEGQERPVLVCEVERSTRSLPIDLIVMDIRQAVSEGHELDLHAVRLIKPMSLPRTSSGKVQRHACREAFLDGSLELVGEWTRADAADTPNVASADVPPGRDRSDLESWLSARLASVLRIPESEIDPRRPISGYGLDSLSAMELKASIDADLNIELPLSSLLDAPTIEELTGLVAGTLESRPTERRDAEPDTAPPIADDALSVGQQSLWYAHQLSPRPGTYNIAGAARIRSEIDVEGFRRAVQGWSIGTRLSDRRFLASTARLVVSVHDRIEAQFLVVDASGWDENRLENARNDRRPPGTVRSGARPPASGHPLASLGQGWNMTSFWRSITSSATSGRRRSSSTNSRRSTGGRRDGRTETVPLCGRPRCGIRITSAGRRRGWRGPPGRSSRPTGSGGSRPRCRTWICPRTVAPVGREGTVRGLADDGAWRNQAHAGTFRRSPNRSGRACTSPCSPPRSCSRAMAARRRLSSARPSRVDPARGWKRSSATSSTSCRCGATSRETRRSRSSSAGSAASFMRGWSTRIIRSAGWSRTWRKARTRAEHRYSP